MRIVCISDTHSLHQEMRNQIPEGDILIHAGDFTGIGLLQEVLDFNEWIRTFPHPHKVVIAGNHDICFEQDRDLTEAYLWDCTYIQDSEITIGGVRIYGSPWQPRFLDWAFNLDRGPELADKWAEIPDNTDVLVTHGPPFGILDETIDGRLVGCADLFHRVEEVQPLLHIFGHIHEAYGTEYRGNTQFINASICNREYIPSNKPIVIDL